MPPDRPSPQERAVAIAKKVDHLFSLNRRNHDYFLSNVETFKQEDAARKEREKDAEKTLNEAVQAVADELEAIKADKATPRLTDKKNRPGPGWEWETGFPDSKDGAPAPDMVEGWIPPEAVRAEAILIKLADQQMYWPGPNPTPATMVALLGALHDECLPDSPTILDPASGKPLSVAQAQDPGLWALFGARLWCVCAKQGATDRLDALETYLNHVKAAIAEVQTAKRGTAPPAVKTPRERARRIALKVDHLFCQNPARWKEQWAAAMLEAEQWHAREEGVEKRRQEALDDVWREKRAVEAGTAKPCLTDEATSPGEFWRWQWVEISDPANRLRVQNLGAWMPPDALGWMPDANSPTEKIWPGRDPTLAAMYLTLAVLHDGIGEGWGKILDFTTADSGAVGFIEVKNFNDGAAELSIRDLPDPGELRYSAQGVERLASHLNAVRADLEAAGPVKVGGNTLADNKTSATQAASSAALPEKWPDVQYQLLEIARRGEKYISLGNLGVRLKCAKGTVRKALKRSPELLRWQAQKAPGALKAQTLNGMVTDNKPSDAPDPADVLPDDDVDRTMARLIEEAKPEERVQLNALDEPARREMARLYNEQERYRHDEEKGVNKILGRKP